MAEGTERVTFVAVVEREGEERKEPEELSPWRRKMQEMLASDWMEGLLFVLIVANTAVIAAHNPVRGR